MNLKGVLYAVLKGGVIIALWFVSSILTIVGALASIYGEERLRHPTDPSIGDALAWMVIFGAPLWIVIGMIGGSVITVLVLALWTNRKAETVT